MFRCAGEIDAPVRSLTSVIFFCAAPRSTGRPRQNSENPPPVHCKKSATCYLYADRRSRVPGNVHFFTKPAEKARGEGMKANQPLSILELFRARKKSTPLKFLKLFVARRNGFVDKPKPKRVWSASLGRSDLRGGVAVGLGSICALCNRWRRRN